ncbi:MAG: thioredoxin domain-containing protein [Candidatus Nanopelagicales bacterium]
MAKNQPESKKTARAKAAAARQEQLAKEKRKERTTRIIIGVVAAVIVVVIIGGAALYANSNSSSSSNVGPDAGHALPKTVNSETYAVPFKPDAKSDLPLVQVWLDPQCPGCKQFSTGGSETALKAAAEANKINLEFRPTTFLDASLGNDSSAQAVSAWGCAIDQGKGNQFLDTMFANQPQEGRGYTTDNFISFGTTAGITGDAATTFNQCVTNGTYLGWAANSTQKYNEEGVPGTPTIYVNGKELSLQGVTPANLVEKVLEAAKQ